MTTSITPATQQPLRRTRPQASSDEQLISLWLRSRRSEHTRRAYARDVQRLLDHAKTQLQQLTLAELLDFADSLAELKPRTQARILSSIKSLLAFAFRTGYIPVNVGAAVTAPSARNELAERILTVDQVQQLLAAAEGRNHTLIALLYYGALRVAEACALRWRDVRWGKGGATLTIFGKGGKTRMVRIPQAIASELKDLRGAAAGDDLVLASSRGGQLDTSQARRIVKAAAARAGLPEGLSPHWLRHSHATHALNAGAPITVVRDTLGHASIATTNMYVHANPETSSADYL